MFKTEPLSKKHTRLSAANNKLPICAYFVKKKEKKIVDDRERPRLINQKYKSCAKETTSLKQLLICSHLK